MANHPYSIAKDSQTNEKTIRTILKRYKSITQKQPSQNQINAFNQIQTFWSEYTHCILDWGCGTGMSTQILASLHPNALVIGVDQSIHRLNKNSFFKHHQQSPTHSKYNNCLLLQGNIVDLALLIHAHQQAQQHSLDSDLSTINEKAPQTRITPSIIKQTFFYPNPWPLHKQLKRRWPTHPIFPILTQLSHHIEMRCNWISYAEQWLTSSKILRPDLKHTTSTISGPAISLFEKKYLDHQSTCYQVISSTGDL